LNVNSYWKPITLPLLLDISPTLGLHLATRAQLPLILAKGSKMTRS